MADFRSDDVNAVPGGGHWRGRWWECRNCGPVERAISDLPQGDGFCPKCPDVTLELGRAQEPPR